MFYVSYDVLWNLDVQEDKITIFASVCLVAMSYLNTSYSF